MDDTQRDVVEASVQWYFVSCRFAMDALFDAVRDIDTECARGAGPASERVQNHAALLRGLLTAVLSTVDASRKRCSHHTDGSIVDRTRERFLAAARAGAGLAPPVADASVGVPVQPLSPEVTPVVDLSVPLVVQPSLDAVPVDDGVSRVGEASSEDDGNVKESTPIQDLIAAALPQSETTGVRHASSPLAPARSKDARLKKKARTGEEPEEPTVVATNDNADCAGLLDDANLDQQVLSVELDASPSAGRKPAEVLADAEQTYIHTWGHVLQTILKPARGEIRSWSDLEAKAGPWFRSHFIEALAAIRINTDGPDGSADRHRDMWDAICACVLRGATVAFYKSPGRIGYVRCQICGEIRAHNWKCTLGQEAIGDHCAAKMQAWVEFCTMLHRAMHLATPDGPSSSYYKLVQGLRKIIGLHDFAPRNQVDDE